MSAELIVGVFVVTVVMIGIVVIAALIINAVVKVKVAKYNSLRPADSPPERPTVRDEGVWPPPPSSPLS